MMRNKMKQKYERLRNEWRQDYGVFSIDFLRGNDDIECLQRAADLLVALGEHRQQQRDTVSNRRYQRKYYANNIERQRKYQREWKRFKRKRSVH